MGQNTLPIFSRTLRRGGETVEGWRWTRKVQVVGKFPLKSSPVVKMVWSNEQRAFAEETYFLQSHSIVEAQRAFRTRYQIPPRDRVPDPNTILLWVENFSGTGSVSKKRTTDLSNSRKHQGSQTVCFAVSQALCMLTILAATCKILFLKLCYLKLPKL
jgi:hypothetical protein